MGFNVLLLLGEVFFDFPEVDDFSRLFFALAEAPFDFFLELDELPLVALDRLRLHALCFFLVVDHFAVPIFVKVTDFFEVSHLNLPLLFLEASEKLIFPVFF